MGLAVYREERTTRAEIHRAALFKMEGSSDIKVGSQDYFGVYANSGSNFSTGRALVTGYSGTPLATGGSGTYVIGLGGTATSVTGLGAAATPTGPVLLLEVGHSGTLVGTGTPVDAESSIVVTGAGGPQNAVSVGSGNVVVTGLSYIQEPLNFALLKLDVPYTPTKTVSRFDESARDKARFEAVDRAAFVIGNWRDPTTPSKETINRTKNLLAALPTSIPTPNIAASVDGELILSWYKNGNSIDVSIDADGVLTWVLKLDGNYIPGDEIRYTRGAISQLDEHFVRLGLG